MKLCLHCGKSWGEHYGAACHSPNDIGAGAPKTQFAENDDPQCSRCDRPFVLVQKGSTAEGIVKVCSEIQTLLLQKNASYGDSATNPIRVFSKADSIEQLKVRIDDKLSRIMRGNAYYEEDVVMDLIGYFILLRVAEKAVKT